MHSKILDQLKRILVEELDINLKMEEVNANISLFEHGLGLDSIAIIEFISLIEQRLKIVFLDSELNAECFSSLNTLAALVATKREMNEAPK